LKQSIGHIKDMDNLMYYSVDYDKKRLIQSQKEVLEELLQDIKE
jgi:hypothetical protein